MTRSKQRWRAAFTLAWLGFPSLGSMPAAAEPAAPPRMLQLFSHDRLLPANVAIDRGFRNALAAQMPDTLLFTEFLDSIRIRPGSEQEKNFTGYLLDRYRDRPPQVLIAIGSEALQFFLANRDTLFPGIPLLFGAVSAPESLKKNPPPGVAGLATKLEMAQTLGAVIRLKPRIHEVAVVSGAAVFDRKLEAMARAEFQPYEDRVRLIWLSGLPLSEVKEKLAAMQPGTAVICLSYFQEPSGRLQVSSMNAVRQITQTAAVPVFGVADTYLDNGITGGRLTMFEKTGEKAAQLALRVLGGEAPGKIGVLDADDSRFIFDDRELRRWGIDRDSLPADSDIRFVAPSPWETHHRLLLGIGIAGFSQTMLIAGLLVLRSRAKRWTNELNERLRFEQLIMDITARFADLPCEKVSDEIARALENIRSLLRMDRCFFFDYFPATGRLQITHHAEAADVAPLEPALDAAQLPWFFSQLRDFRTVCLEDAQRDLPEEAANEREYARRHSLKSVLAIALPGAHDVIQGVSFQTTRKFQSWPAHLRSRLQIISEMLVSTLAALRTEMELHRSEERFSKAFHASPIAIAIIRAGDAQIVDINESWERQFRFSREDAIGNTPAGLGLFDDDTHRLEIRSLLDGGESLKDHEVLLRDKHAKSIIANLSVETITIHEEPCFIAIMHDVTGKKQAEELRQNMAHVSRLALIGEITASIAHEINQPLGAILSNAEAAELLLETAPPMFDEVRHILSDIRKDDLRASDIIRHIRDLLRKRELRLAYLDVNQTVENVIRLVAADARKRSVVMTTELASGLPPAMGDQVHLQQVLLNLIINGMEAMAGTPAPAKRLVIRSRPTDAGDLEIAVIDAGHGIAPSHMPRLFESFFTTKAEGLGLGLAMARSIMEAHRGQICASNNPGGGATFSFILPASPP